MVLDTLKQEDLPAALLAALWHLPGDLRIEQLRMTKREMWEKLKKLNMLERAIPELTQALEGLVQEYDRLGYPPTTKLIYGRVVLGKLRSGGYETASPIRTAENVGGGGGPEKRPVPSTKVSI